MDWLHNSHRYESKLIRTLKEILGEPVSPDADSARRTLAELQVRSAELQAKTQQRQ